MVNECPMGGNVEIETAEVKVIGERRPDTRRNVRVALPIATATPKGDVWALTPVSGI
jgi:hypothetical protein